MELMEMMTTVVVPCVVLFVLGIIGTWVQGEPIGEVR